MEIQNRKMSKTTIYINKYKFRNNQRYWNLTIIQNNVEYICKKMQYLYKIYIIQDPICQLCKNKAIA